LNGAKLGCENGGSRGFAIVRATLGCGCASDRAKQGCASDHAKQGCANGDAKQARGDWQKAEHGWKRG